MEFWLSKTGLRSPAAGHLPTTRSNSTPITPSQYIPSTVWSGLVISCEDIITYHSNPVGRYVYLYCSDLLSSKAYYNNYGMALKHIPGLLTYELRNRIGHLCRNRHAIRHWRCKKPGQIYLLTFIQTSIAIDFENGIRGLPSNLAG